ncbi:hypothetical protein T265_09572 [Opisthorchis viverrini]|uniref:Uncharacterized protein n=1 Tax=Opisthorchis viverrini TaxID=6198 RepID=A0A074ZGA1_OPIVI|nr:hypothetical protein T265_09572 [Opisthorchis viverrini]KER22285.1 hypothetical protein T265_09572 [Opisthorchis viverrini]
MGIKNIGATNGTAQPETQHRPQRLLHSNISLTETRGLRPPDESQEGRNRSWAADEFSATL